MKTVGTILVVLGGFALASVVLSLFGTRLREVGIDIVAYVTSVRYTLLAGSILLVFGLWLRRRGPRVVKGKGSSGPSTS